MLAPALPRPPSLLKRVLGAFNTPTPPAARPYSEMGVSGTAVYSGWVQIKERSSQWVGAQRYITISDMAVNASIVAAGVHYFLNLIAHPKWTLEPADESAEAAAAAELVDECLHDLSQPWSRVVRRAGAYRFYGFGVQEWTAKKRRDGKIGLASIETRPQSTIEQWSVDEAGSVIGVWQRGPQTGELFGIPRKKLLYLVDDVLSDSPEGIGIFRHLAEPWERLKQYYILEARAFERDLRGTPVGRVPYTMIREAVANGDITKADADRMVAAMESFVKLQVKANDTAITLDSIPYFSQAADGPKVAATQQWGLELLQGGAAGMVEVAAAITRTQTEMARIIACEGLMMGEQSGNRSLGEDKSKNLYLIGNAVLSDIVAGVEQDIIPVICDLNGIAEELRPIPKVEDIAFKDAEAVAAVLQRMAQAGAVLQPDDPVIEDVRSLMGVSPPPPPSPEMLGLTSPEPDGPDEGGGGEGEPGSMEDEDEDDEDIQKNFDPNQPRDDDGKWTDGGGGGSGDGLFVEDEDTIVRQKELHKEAASYFEQNPEEALAVQRYQRQGAMNAGQINDYLRAGRNDDPKIDSAVRLLDGATGVNKLSGDFYRGVAKIGDLKLPTSLLEAEKLVGRTVTEPGYMSTSIKASNFLSGENQMLRIKGAEKGVLVAAARKSKAITNSIGRRVLGEGAEVLLPRNTQLKITKVTSERHPTLNRDVLVYHAHVVYDAKKRQSSVNHKRSVPRIRSSRKAP